MDSEKNIESSVVSIANSLKSQSLFWNSDEAVKQLRQFGKAAIVHIVHYLDSTDPHIRYAAVVCLGRLPQDPPITIPALISCSDDSDYNVSYSAENFLNSPKSIKIDNTSVLAIPKIIELIKKKANEHSFKASVFRIYDRTINTTVRKDKSSYGAAWRIMQRIGKEALPFVIGLLDEKDEAIRVDASLFIEPVVREAQDAIAPISALLHDSNRYIRAMSVRILGKLSSNALAAMPPLIEALGDTARFYAAGGEYILPTREEILSSLREIDEIEGNYSVSELAEWSLKEITGKSAGSLDINTQQEFYRKYWIARSGDLHRG